MGATSLPPPPCWTTRCTAPDPGRDQTVTLRWTTLLAQMQSKHGTAGRLTPPRYRSPPAIRSTSPFSRSRGCQLRRVRSYPRPKPTLVRTRFLTVRVMLTARQSGRLLSTAPTCPALLQPRYRAPCCVRSAYAHTSSPARPRATHGHTSRNCFQVPALSSPHSTPPRKEDVECSLLLSRACTGSTPSQVLGPQVAPPLGPRPGPASRPRPSLLVLRF